MTSVSTVRDPASRGVVDLLGIIAYTSLASFEHIAHEAAGAPTLADKLQMSRIAAARFRHLDRVEAELQNVSSDLQSAMEPFERPVDDFHSAAAPHTWAESLLKLVIVSGLVNDLVAEVADNLPAGFTEIMRGSVVPGELLDYPTQRLSQLITEDPAQVGRLSLFGRRLLGEALGQGQRIAARHDSLTSLITGSPSEPADDLAKVSEIISRLVGAHSARMDRLGLTS